MSSVVVGLCTVELQVPASASLKDKRRVIKSVLARIRRAYNVSVAEIGHLDSWQLATVCLTCVSGDVGYAHGLLERVVTQIEADRHGVVLLDYEIEML
jgi:hypothetical protein